MSKDSKSNPIDPDKVAENPHLLPYAHTIGSAIIKPLDKGKIKGTAMTAMYEQTSTQLHDIKAQIDQLIQRAQHIHDRIDISEKVYLADCNFQPLLGKEYYLYEKSDGTWVLSMVSAAEWGPNPPYDYLATVLLQHDHTWKVIDTNQEKAHFEI